MSEPTDWAAFQTLFLDVLAKNSAAEEITHALLASDLTTPQREWVEAMQPQMLETAAKLVKQWGQRVPD